MLFSFQILIAHPFFSTCDKICKSTHLNTFELFFKFLDPGLISIFRTTSPAIFKKSGEVYFQNLVSHYTGIGWLRVKRFSRRLHFQIVLKTFFDYQIVFNECMNLDC